MALQRDALRDPETGLVNRLLFLDRLGAAVLRTRRAPGYDCALALVRVLDGPTVPTQGRLDGVGDARLDLHRELVRRLRRSLREGDTPARIAEDDFVVLLDDVGPGGMPARLSLLLDQLRQELGSRVAIGVLGSIRGFRDVGEVLREADITVLRGASRPGRPAPGSVLR